MAAACAPLRRPVRGPVVLACLMLAYPPLAGCVSAPRTVTDAGDADLSARQALAARRTAGPILAVIHGQPFDLSAAERDALVTAGMADGVRGLSVQFTTDPSEVTSPEPHLVVVLNPLAVPLAGQICAQPQRIATEPAGERLTVAAAFCQDDQPIGAARAEDVVTGPGDRSFKRLLWRTSAALFPDDYEERFGFDLLPGIDFGVGGSFGF